MGRGFSVRRFIPSISEARTAKVVIGQGKGSPIRDIGFLNERQVGLRIAGKVYEEADCNELQEAIHGSPF
jgi:hypothetical protein